MVPREIYTESFTAQKLLWTTKKKHKKGTAIATKCPGVYNFHSM